MSEKSTALLDKLEHDPELRHKMESASTAEEQKKVLHSAGFDMNQSDMQDLMNEAQREGDVSDEDLDNVAGAGQIKIFTITVISW